MAKSREAFRTISEVADWLDTPAHVLRFWESKFSQIKPVKRAGGRRYYRPTDMALIGGIKQLLHVDGMTIKGVQKVLREQGVKHVASLSPPLDDALDGAEETPATEAPETAPRVVPFQARSMETPEPPTEAAPAEAPAVEEPPVEAPAAVHEDIPAPEPDMPTAEDAPGETTAPPPAPEPESPVAEETAANADEPALPGFMRPAPAEPSEPVAADAPAVEEPPAPEPAVASKAPANVPVPDDPEDAALAAKPGPLSAALRLKDLDAAQFKTATEAMSQLRALRDRMAAQR